MNEDRTPVPAEDDDLDAYRRDAWETLAQIARQRPDAIAGEFLREDPTT